MRPNTPDHVRDSSSRSETEDGAAAAAIDRRGLVTALGSAVAVGVAGCTGGGSGDGEPGDDGPDTPGSPGDTDGTDDDDAAGGGEDGPTEGGVGDELSGSRANFAVEYVERVEAVLEYGTPDSYDPEYEFPVTEDDLRERGALRDEDELYAVGVAIQNTDEGMLDVSTLLANSDGAGAMPAMPGRSQEAFLNTGRDSSRYALPGELQRGEVMFGFPEDPAEFELTFEPFVVGRADTLERLTVDLGGGAEATTSFEQQLQPEPLGEPVTVGDFEVTMHSIERVEHVDGTESEESWGPRSGYEYLAFEFDVTRVEAAMGNSQTWSFGTTSDDGNAFWWTNVYSDAIEINRATPEELSVGDTAEDYVFAFPIETSFDPEYATLEFIGPPEDDSENDTGRMYRAAWSLE